MSIGLSLAEVLLRQRAQLSKTHQLDLSGNIRYERHDVLGQLGSQRSLHTLVLKDSPLTTFKTLPRQPFLKTLIAQDSKVENLCGLHNQPRLATVDLSGTPVSQCETFRLCLCICVGARLASINGIPVVESERLMAKCYPPIAKALVGLGWIASYPPPSKLDFQYLAAHFGIEATDEDCTAPGPPPDLPFFSPESAKVSVSEPVTFPEQLSQILRPLGFPIRAGKDQSGDILKAVAQICRIIHSIEKVATSESLA
jgi:hypothetical protein